MPRPTLITSMIAFTRNSRPHRVAGGVILIATLYLVYVSVHQHHTEHVTHHDLVSKNKLTLKLLEERTRNGDYQPGVSSSSSNHMDDTLKTPKTEPKKERSASTTSALTLGTATQMADNRAGRWIQSQVSEEVHWLDNATLHKFPPIVPVRCKTGITMSPILKKDPIKFLPNYKNPCWVEPIEVPIPELYQKNGFRHYSASYKKVFHHLKTIYKSQKSAFPSRIRCLPYFFISGQPKCGSTDLYNKLINHPHITTPPTKESHWWGKNRYGWCLNYSRPIPFDDYVDLYDYASIEIQSLTDGLGEDGQEFHPVITGDASVSTLWSNDDWWTNPENCGLTEPLYTNAHHLHHVLPGARIIVILRNPTDRLYSDYLYFRVRKSISDFHEVVETAIHSLNDCFDTMGIRSCVYNASLSYGSRVRIRIGLYHVFLQEWLSVFPREQILVLSLEDYSSQPLETMKKVHKFLGLKELSEQEHEEVMNQPKSNTRRNSDKRLGSMMNKTRDLLNDFYRPFNIKLARLMNNPAFLWEH